MLSAHILPLVIDLMFASLNIPPLSLFHCSQTHFFFHYLTLHYYFIPFGLQSLQLSAGKMAAIPSRVFQFWGVNRKIYNL